MTNLMNALGFLTIIKISGKYIKSKEKISDSLVYFPLIGLFIGLALSVFYFALNFVTPVFLSVIFMVILQIVITGGAHIDGLCDMSDGVFSGRREKSEILKIMKKSDIGVYGVLAIIFLLLLKISLVYYLAEANPSNSIFFYLVILFMPAFGRWSMVYLMGRHGNARGSSSLASIFTEKENKKKPTYLSSVYLFPLFITGYIASGYFLTNGAVAVFSGSLTSGPLGLFTLFYLLIKAISAVVIFLLMLLFVSWFFTRRLGGITGDIIGGTSEIMEVLFLLINFIIFRLL